jgi:hypothetical protein
MWEIPSMFLEPDGHQYQPSNQAGERTKSGGPRHVRRSYEFRP